MIAYKFLSSGAIGLYSGFRWPVPSNDDPRRWVEVSGPPVAGVNGVHAVTATELVNWIDDELWLVELGGEIEERDGILIAQRGRLVRLVGAWNAAAARAFTEDCVLRARECAVEALRRAGRANDAHAVEELSDFDALQAYAAALSTKAEGFAADGLAYVADAIELARGGRPDHYDAHPAASLPVSPGAIAANLGFVVAHAAGCALADTNEDPAHYEAGFERERDHQRAWLTKRIGVRESGLAAVASA